MVIVADGNARPPLTGTLYAGSDLDGVDKAKNRTLTVPNQPRQVVLERESLHEGVDWDFLSLGGTFTIIFSVNVYNQMRITVYT